MLLLIPDKMLRTRNGSRILDPLDCFRHSNSSQNGVGAKAFPIPASFRMAPDWSCHRAELYVDYRYTISARHI